MNEQNLINLLNRPQNAILKDSVLNVTLRNLSFEKFINIILEYPDVYQKLSLKQDYWEDYFRIKYYNHLTSINKDNTNWFYECIRVNFTPYYYYYSFEIPMSFSYLISSSIPKMIYRKFFNTDDQLVYDNNLFSVKDIKYISYFNIFDIVILMSSGDLLILYETKLGNKDIKMKLILNNVSKVLADVLHLICLTYDNKLIKTTIPNRNKKENREHNYDIVATNIKDINFHFINNLKGKTLSIVDTSNKIYILNEDDFSIFKQVNESTDLLKSSILILTTEVAYYDIFMNDDNNITIIFSVANGGLFIKKLNILDKEVSSTIHRIPTNNKVKEVYIKPIYLITEIIDSYIEKDKNTGYEKKKEFVKETIYTLENVLYLYKTEQESIYLVKQGFEQKINKLDIPEENISNYYFNVFGMYEKPSIYSQLIVSSYDKYHDVTIRDYVIYAINNKNELIYIYLSEFNSSNEKTETFTLERGILPKDTSYMFIDDRNREILFKVKEKIVIIPYFIYLFYLIKKEVVYDNIRDNDIIFRLQNSNYKFQTTIIK